MDEKVLKKFLDFFIKYSDIQCARLSILRKYKKIQIFLLIMLNLYLKIIQKSFLKPEFVKKIQKSLILVENIKLFLQLSVFIYKNQFFLIEHARNIESTS